MLKAPEKPGRVKVGIRCRPPFDDEVQGTSKFDPVVNVHNQDDESSMALIQLTLAKGRKRDFYFDYGFGPGATQDQVYSCVARPVVSEVLRGYNGTVFAYGQTGTGKTYTMGILNVVQRESAGIVPRAIEHIFSDLSDSRQGQIDTTVSMSFLQIYNNSIQDLLATSPSQMDENLQLRENPRTGFYVEGLNQFAVGSLDEAQALVNFGLENRAMAPTLMNITSSRSHTVLTINIEKSGEMPDDRGGDGGTMSRTLRGKLMLVDLAGSERVRRTTSKGTRLSEAKAINMSLSILGNVIAALAEPGSQHVPYRDSKLTRLLQDSLGGTASTALIATVGPAAVNQSESFSTLLFASRCMAVKSSPVQHEEVDYAELCAKMQARIVSMEQDHQQRSLEQQHRYEEVIRHLASQVDDLKQGAPRLAQAEGSFGAIERREIPSAFTGDGAHWIQSSDPSEYIRMIVDLYGSLSDVTTAFQMVLLQNQKREDEQRESLERALASLDVKQQVQRQEEASFAAHDPLAGTQAAEALGPHLSPLSFREARNHVDSQFPSNNLGADDREDTETNIRSCRAPLENFDSADALSRHLAGLKGISMAAGKQIDALLGVKDSHYHDLKHELTALSKERRQHEEEVVNWSYVLKYLLATNSKLRQQIRLERRDPRERERQFPEPLPRPSLAESQDAANFKPSSSSSKLEARKIDAKIGQSTPQGGFDRPMSPGSIKKLLPDDASTSALIQRVSTMTPEEISTLPPDARESIWQLRHEIAVLNGGISPASSLASNNDRVMQSMKRGSGGALQPQSTPASVMQAGSMDRGSFRRPQGSSSSRRFHSPVRSPSGSDRGPTFDVAQVTRYAAQDRLQIPAGPGNPFADSRPSSRSTLHPAEASDDEYFDGEDDEAETAADMALRASNGRSREVHSWVG